MSYKQPTRPLTEAEQHLIQRLCNAGGYQDSNLDLQNCMVTDARWDGIVTLQLHPDHCSMSELALIAQGEYFNDGQGGSLVGVYLTKCNLGIHSLLWHRWDRKVTLRQSFSDEIVMLAATTEKEREESLSLRQPTSAERALLYKLTASIGRYEQDLNLQIQNCMVQEISDEYSIELYVTSAPPVPAMGCIAEGWYQDGPPSPHQYGSEVSLLLHVSPDGYLYLLQFFKPDTTKVLHFPNPDEIFFRQ